MKKVAALCIIITMFFCLVACYDTPIKENPENTQEETHSSDKSNQYTVEQYKEIIKPDMPFEELNTLLGIEFHDWQNYTSVIYPLGLEYTDINNIAIDIKIFVSQDDKTDARIWVVKKARIKQKGCEDIILFDIRDF